MTIEELDFRIKALFARGRNIVYYRKIDLNIPRPRVTYVHVLRTFRKNLEDIFQEITSRGLYEEYVNYYNLFGDLMRIIDPRITAQECMAAIVKIEEVYNKNGIDLYD